MAGNDRRAAWCGASRKHGAPAPSRIAAGRVALHSSGRPSRGVAEWPRRAGTSAPRRNGGVDTAVIDTQGSGALASGSGQNPVKSKREFLRSVALFERLPNPALDRLALAFERHKFADGEVVFHQGDRGDRLYLAEFGTVDLMRTDGGHTHRLARVEAGGYFGELAL